MQPEFIIRLLRIGCVVLSGVVCAAAQEAEAPAPRAAETQEAFVAEVKKNFAAEAFDALDQAAVQARYRKERFPGAEWKLAVFYRTLTWPEAGLHAGDPEWKNHLARLQRWADKSADSMTARVALGAAWVEYAKKVRTDAVDWQAIDKEIGGKHYQSRLRQAEKALNFDPAALMSRIVGKLKSDFWPKTSTRLRSHCPHWYVVRLAVEQGRLWEWERYNNLFAEAVALEPTYYPIYALKATDLLPRNHGLTTQWEGFTTNSADQIGGPEGDITYFRNVAHVRPLFDNSVSQENFFRDHRIAVRRLIAGYEQIEARYGATSRQTNELALLLCLARNYAAARPLFTRIGENWDAAVWRNRAAFDGYRNLVLASAPPVKSAAPAPAPPARTRAGLKAELTAATARFAKSEAVVIQAVVENPRDASDAADFAELGVAVFSLLIQDAHSRRPATILRPQSDRLRTQLNPGELVDLAYRFNFSLPPGEYKIRMQSIPSNELLIRIGAPANKRERISKY
jgi:hypothetical protein